MPVKIRRSYKGAAVSAVLDSSGVTSATQTSIALSTSPSTWPTGKFFVVVAPGTAQEEKMCVTLSGSTLTVVNPAVTSTSASANGRGVDNTTARSTIAGGATVYPVFTAVDADEANELTSTYANQGGIVYQGASTFAQLAIGTAAQVLKVNSGATAPEWGQITAANIASDAVTTAKILDANVTTAKIADSAITSAKIANGTIATADIADGAITAAKLDAAVFGGGTVPMDGSVTTAKIADSAVTSAKIADGTIVAGDIADGAITLAKLASAVANALVPVGTIAMYGGASAPTGWLLCNGTSTTGYTALAAIVGANTPDLRGRFAIGDNATLTLLGTGGSLTISTSNLPSHTHTIDHDHGSVTSGGMSANATLTHSASTVTTYGYVGGHDHELSSGTLATSPVGGTSVGTSTVTVGNHDVSHTHTVDLPNFTGNSGTAGSGTDYYPPYLVVNYIIKHD